jgi:hypothetical protein
MYCLAAAGLSKTPSEAGAENRLATRGRWPAISSPYRFLDFVAGGLELQLAVAIDFTASNGSPTSPTSKHRLQAGALNDYEKAITAVGGVIAPYSAEQRFAGAHSCPCRCTHARLLFQSMALAEIRVRTLAALIRSLIASLWLATSATFALMIPIGADFVLSHSFKALVECSTLTGAR